MSIESILETQHFGYALSTSALTVAAGSVNATATNYGNLTVGDLIRYLDDAGVLRYGQIAALPGAPNVTLETAAQAATTAKTMSLQSTPTTRFFESNNAVTKVGLVNVAAAQMEMRAPNGLRTFNQHEGFTIKSVYVRLPYQYTFADGQVDIEFQYFSTAGAFIANVQTVGELGAIYVQVENIEIPVNGFVPALALPFAANQNYRIHAFMQSSIANIGVDATADQQSPTISCLDAPAALNGAIIPITIGMRIEHAATALIA